MARILALQSAVYARKFGDLALEDHHEYLKATEQDMARAVAGDDSGRMVGLLRDGAVALVGVLAVVSEGIGREANHRCSNLDAWAPREISPDSTLGPLSAQKRTVGRRTRRRRGGRHFRSEAL